MDAQEHTADRQKILNEIKRLKDWEPETIPQPQRRKEIQCARLGVLIGLEEFINSLPAEQSSRELESEIKLYLLRNPVVNHSETSLNELIKRAAVYFANWQKEQTINKACDYLSKLKTQDFPGAPMENLFEDYEIYQFKKVMEKEGEQ